MRAARFITFGILAMLMFAGCRGKGHWESDEVEKGYEGEAARDPLLAAKRLMGRFGYEINRSSGLVRTPVEGGTLILSSDAVTSYTSTAKVERWVRRGGHLIYCLEGLNRSAGLFEQLAAAANEEKEDFILRRFELDRVADGEHLFRVSIDGEPDLDVEIGGRYSIDAPGWRSSDDAQKFLTFNHGEGRMTVLADAAALRNTEIEKGDHARFLIGLLDYGWGSDVWLVSEAERSIFPLLWKYGWMAVIALLVLIVFWLWKNMPRFGPVSDVDESAGIGRFGEHISTAGKFLWRRKCSASLLGPLRRRLTRAYVNASAGARPDEMAEWLAERSGLPLERVRRSLEESPANDGAAMVAIVSDLQRIQSTL